MADAFICYVEEDGGLVRELADGLADAGISAWYYERDSYPGETYLKQTMQAISACSAVILLVSPVALANPHQMEREITQAYEERKKFVPILVQVTVDDFRLNQPVWHNMTGAATAVRLPPGGPSELMPKLVQGLKKLGIGPGVGFPDADRGTLQGRPAPSYQGSHAYRVVAATHLKRRMFGTRRYTAGGDLTLTRDRLQFKSTGVSTPPGRWWFDVHKRAVTNISTTFEKVANSWIPGSHSSKTIIVDAVYPDGPHRFEIRASKGGDEQTEALFGAIVAWRRSM